MKTSARRTATALLAATAALALVACSSSSTGSTTSSAVPTASDGSTLISAERCQQNRAAGKITVLTSYVFAASVGILDVVAADQLGYLKALCLDVELQPGSTNAQLVSAGTAQIAGLGSASDVMVARASDAKNLQSIATYGNQGAIEILTMGDSGINSLADFAGKTVGYKVAISAQFSAMFKDNGVDPSTINWVSVGFDPQILPDGQVQALGAFKSNEPNVLRNRGYDVKEWDPEDYGVRSTFNTQVVNTEWGKAHPTAVEDFLRASFKAYDWINASDANLDTALGWAKDRSEAGYDLAMSKLRWQTEVKLVKDSQPAGLALGQQSEDQWKPEADALVTYKLVPSAPSITDSQNNSFIDAIYGSDGTLIWPAP